MIRLSPLCVLPLIAALVGCGGDGMDKVVVSGTVSYNGQPIENGEILFYPIGDTEGPVSGARIVGGEYETSGKGGVPAGRHRVEIRGYEAVAVDAPSGIPPEDLPGQQRQYVPPRFNANSELEREVPAGAGSHTLDFELSGQ